MRSRKKPEGVKTGDPARVSWAIEASLEASCSFSIICSKAEFPTAIPVCIRVRHAREKRCPQKIAVATVHSSHVQSRYCIGAGVKAIELTVAIIA